MTLATCEGIVYAGRVSPEAIADRFAEWFQRRRLRGIGASTYKALSELAMGGHWALVGRKGEMAAGNGAAMRIAPLAFFCDPSIPDDRTTIRDVCRITHHSDEAYAGALAVAIAIRLAYIGEWTGGANLISAVAEALPDSRVRDRLREIVRGAADLPIPELAKRFGNSGFVAESVPLALVGAERVARIGFVEALHQINTAGGDSDTIGSITGQIAGCLLGVQGIPGTMLERITEREEIERTSAEFTTTVLKQTVRGLANPAI